MKTLLDLQKALEGDNFDKKKAIELLDNLFWSSPSLLHLDYKTQVVTKVWSLDDIQMQIQEKGKKCSKRKTREIFDIACKYLSETQDNDWDFINEVISEEL